jgi:hypothetical protein
MMMIGAILTCLVDGVAIAQDKPADQTQILREKARADKELVVATALALTEGEAKATSDPSVSSSRVGARSQAAVGMGPARYDRDGSDLCPGASISTCPRGASTYSR